MARQKDLTPGPSTPFPTRLSSPPPLCGQGGVPEASTWWLPAPSSLSSLNAFQGLCSLELKSISDFSILCYFFFFLLNHRLIPDGDGMPSKGWASFQALPVGTAPRESSPPAAHLPPPLGPGLSLCSTLSPGTP